MVGRKFIALKCFKSDKPTLPLKLYNLLGESFELNFRVDTGFDGPIVNIRKSIILSRILVKILNGYLVMKTSK